jgi:hypothetical protein
MNQNSLISRILLTLLKSTYSFQSGSSGESKYSTGMSKDWI